jgi:hypothetical protein
MSDEVVIKYIEDETILLEDTYTSIFTMKSGIKAGIAFLCFTVLFYGIGLFAYTLTANPTPIPIINFVIMGLIVTVLLAVMGGSFNEEIPAYVVRLQGRYNTRREIKKTTPGNDQIAICRAAKQLEAEAWVIVKKDRELELIAQNCNKEVK